MSQVRDNALRDPAYAPYCGRCPGLVRMRRVEFLFWRCTCGAEHDERFHIDVTITGADDRVDPHDLVKLSTEFPFVEWAILFSVSRSGPRYPSNHWFSELGKAAPPRLALHLCGSAARDTIEGSSSWIGSVLCDFKFQRVQLNGFSRCAYENPRAVKLRSCVLRFPRIEFILQVHSEIGLAIIENVRAIHDAGGMASILYDPSGGRGIEGAFRDFVRPFATRLGYAGGIGPDNVERIINDIGPGDPYWIDMESGVRTDDRFDLAKVRSVLEKVAAVNAKWRTAP